jgi:ABC-2 type transport system ATP-binding protein
MIEIDRVSKAFGDRLALDTVSLDIRRGEILALLGHNGAGKSTLFAMLLGLLRLSAGDIRIGGVSVRHRPCEARRRVGSVLAPSFYEYLSGWDNLRLLASYSEPVSPSELTATVRFVGLAERIHDRVRVYSHGMRRRLALAQALVPRPDVLLLDEWEEGLDPEGRRDMRELIEGLHRDTGMTIMMSSHHPDDLAGLAERVAVLRHGRLVFVGSWHDLDDGPSAVRLDVDDWQRAQSVLGGLHADIRPDGSVVPPVGLEVADLVAALVRADVRVHAVEPIRASTDALYLRALHKSPTQRSARTAAGPRAVRDS